MTGPDVATSDQIARQVFGPLFETSPHPMVVCDDHLRFVAVNASYESFVQRPRHQLLGHLPDENRDRFPDQQGQLARLLMGAADACETEVEVLRPDGTTRWATVIGQAVRDDGTLEYIGLELTDITDIRRAQRELAAQVDVSAVIREATSLLASGPDVQLTTVVSDLISRLVSSTRIEVAAVAWRRQGKGRLAAARTAADEICLEVDAAEVDELVGLGSIGHLDVSTVPGLGDWPSTPLQLHQLGEHEPIGWFAFAGPDGTPPAPSTVDAITDFLEQAWQRVTRASDELQHMRLQGFVNETASDYLAHRFTGDRQEVLDGTLAGLAGILDADNAQFRIVDWDRMVSEITAEFVAAGHSETDDDFRVLDLNVEMFRDIAAATEPCSFEMAGMRGQDVSILNVPLVVEGTTTATLNVAGPGGRRWSEIEIEACRSVAGLMVQLQRRTELERTLATRLELGDVVKRIATEFNEATADAAESAIDDALGELAITLEAPRIALWRHDNERRTAALDRVWQEGTGGFSLAGIGHIDVDAHTDARALFASTTTRALTPAEIPTSFGDIPDDLHLLYVPVARNGQARLALSIESWIERVWTAAEIAAAQSVAQLIAQLLARVNAERAMVRRLALEDVTRKVATDMLQLSNRTSVDGLHEAFGAVGGVLGVDSVALWLVDRRDEVLSLVTQWVPAERSGIEEGSSLDIDESVWDLAAQPRQVIPFSDRGCALSTLDGPALTMPLARVDEDTSSFLVFEREGVHTWTSEEQQGLDVLGSLIAQLGARLQAESYFETAFANAPVGISLRDADGRLLACNPAFEEFVGRSQEDLLGTMVLSELRPEYVDSDAREREFRLRRPDGTYVWGRVTEAQVHVAGE
ncbi:MAG: PAS domain S-box protein, partial [Acidimicrobiia bacterium]|nr:PAS domain S-box protein [Acidimicrobiia bacterium]